MKPTFLFIALVGVGLAQTPDAFTGTWKLNTQKSLFTERSDTYTGGTRTYAPAKNGTRVSWKMYDADGKEEVGEYTVQCKDRVCVSEKVRWREKNARFVAGDLLTNGVVVQTYARKVSSDGKTITTTFYRVGKKEATAVQVWEKQ